MAGHTPLAQHQDAGDYRISGVIGSGGMSTVYRAVHRVHGHEVALKIAGWTGDQAIRFEHETRILASLAHPHIAAMHESFEHAGQRCLVMELVEGESLANRIARGPLGADEAIGIVRQIASAAAFMHARGIVHRDLTPANIRFARDGRVKVLDFGIAKVGHWKRLTREGHVIGTPGYLSPEQLRTSSATPASDVWAMGILLFEMVTGHRPFGGTFPHEVSRAIGTEARFELGPTPHLTPTERTRVHALLTRCLAIDPRARATSGELAEAHTSPGFAAAERFPLPARIAFAAMAGLAVIFLVLQPQRGGAPQTVHRIEVAEGVAEVVINGTRRGRTPLEYEAAPREAIDLELRQPGFEPLRQHFVVTDRPVWTFAMRRQP